MLSSPTRGPSREKREHCKDRANYGGDCLNEDFKELWYIVTSGVVGIGRLACFSAVAMAGEEEMSLD